jgi:Domain of unknown function (DUF4234)/Protein of unknown function (DUF2510)
MASNEVLIRGAPLASKAKIRNPVWVVVWSFLTLGIYSWFWWYFINREMRDLGQARGTDELGDNPTLSALAVSLGALILVPPFVSFYGTSRRIQAAQRLTLGRETYNGWIALLLLVVWLFGITLFIPLQFGYIQSELNKVWKNPNVTDPLQPGLPHPGVPTSGYGAPLPPTAQPAPGTQPQQPGVAAQQPAAPGQQPAAAGQEPTPAAEAPAAAAEPATDATQETPAQQPAGREAAPATPPADWYPDPTGQARLRYWDGEHWTQHTAQ